MKKCLLSILLATVLLCACAQQTDNTLQTPESSTLVELTVATEETVIETPAPLATESPAPAPTQTPEPTATPAPTEIPISEPTAAPTEAPATEPVAAESQPAQVSMSYGAVPFDLAAGSEEWWSIDSSASVYWAVQENINAMRAAAGLSPLTMDSGLSAAADARDLTAGGKNCQSFVSGLPGYPGALAMDPDGTLYIGSTPYGLEGGTAFYLYTPEASTDVLTTEALQVGWPEWNLPDTVPEGQLGCWMLYNQAMDQAFFSYE